MTFGMTLTEHLKMAASPNMFYFAIEYENGLAASIVIRWHVCVKFFIIFH